MKHSEINEENIELLVRSFYAKICKDKKLAPIFIITIGETDEEWEPHLQTMCNFWSSIMLSSGKYHGSPVQKHVELPEFDSELFDHWLMLFEKTAAEIYELSIVERYEAKSRRIADSLKLMLYYKPKPIRP